MEDTIRVKKLTCSRCGFSWPQRATIMPDGTLSVKTPRQCGRCKSPYWDTPRTRNIKRPEEPTTPAETVG